ncbi:hypothetical protein [Bradyrhizobium sp. URHC0002]
MRFSIKAKCKDGEILHRRKTPEAALKKAREMSQTGCYDIHITTPEGQDYHSSELQIYLARPLRGNPLGRLEAEGNDPCEKVVIAAKKNSTPASQLGVFSAARLLKTLVLVGYT